MGRIARFLSRKVILLTGSTGFLAKGILEKILREAPDVGRIYLLIRPGAGGAAAERLEREVLCASVFSRLRALHGGGFDDFVGRRLVAVDGDLTQTRLGLDRQTYDQLADEVDVVINSAASVVFDEALDLALDLNTLGPSRVLEFAKACRNAVFVHVSTAYVSGQLTGRIAERLYGPDQSVAELLAPAANGRPARFDLQGEIGWIMTFARQVEADSHRSDLAVKFRRTLDRLGGNGRQVGAHRLRHQLDAVRKRWVRDRLVAEGLRRGRMWGWHDCYTYTKAMGEQLIARDHGQLPTVIVRPTIIESSLADPEPGWLDGLKVADPLILHYSKGRLPDFPADPDIILDVIPVDQVASATLAALLAARPGPEIPVIHVASGAGNPLRLGEMFDLMHEYFLKNPVLDRKGEAIRVQRWTYPSPEAFRRYCRIKYGIPLTTMLWIMERSPALPWSARFKQRVSALDAALDRMLFLMQIYSPYMHLDCVFETDRAERLWDSLEDDDRETFNFDVKRIDWPRYVQEIHIPALRRQSFKEYGSSGYDAESEERVSRSRRRSGAREWSVSVR
jgi:thioester reductase-like protein